MFRNLKIRTKLLCMVLLPVLGLACFSAETALQKYRIMQRMEHIRTLASLAVHASAMIHEMQKERGFTVGVAASKGAKFLPEMVAQREKTDREVATVTGFLTAAGSSIAEVREPLDRAQGVTAKLAAQRQAASGYSLEPKEVVSFYSDLIARWLDVVSAVARSGGEEDVVRYATAYVTFLNAKEQCGRERAILNGVFTSGKFDDESFRKAVAVTAARDTYLRLFDAFASDSGRGALKEKMGGSFAARVDEMERKALEAGAAGATDVPAEEWFTAITAKINAMKEVEDRLSQELDKTVAALYASARSALVLTLLASIVLSGVALAAGAIIFLSIMAPLNGILAMLRDMAEGEGDLTKRLDESRRDELGEICRRFNLFVVKIADIISRVADGTGKVASSSSSLRSSSGEMAEGAEQLASESAILATASEEMAATSHEIARNCSLAAQSTNQAMLLAQEGSTVVGETVAAMDQVARRVSGAAATVSRLGERSDEISRIVETITDIADQTNLLALNAAIEAARAGEQGRGFAVVADEVRALAERTTRSTKEIASMIRTIVSETAEAVSSMEKGVQEVELGTRNATRSGASLQEILTQIDAVASQISQVATAAEEQTATTVEITGNIQKITAVAQTTAEGSAQNAASAAELDELADQLRRMASMFRLA